MEPVQRGLDLHRLGEAAAPKRECLRSNTPADREGRGGAGRGSYDPTHSSHCMHTRDGIHPVCRNALPDAKIARQPKQAVPQLTADAADLTGASCSGATPARARAEATKPTRS